MSLCPKTPARATGPPTTGLQPQAVPGGQNRGQLPYREVGTVDSSAVGGQHRDRR